MRLVSYRPAGASPADPWRAGVSVGGRVIDAADAARSLGERLAEPPTVRGLLCNPELLPALHAAATNAHPIGELGTVQLGPPVPDPDKILCIGLNYVDHANETKLEVPPVPTVFPKFRNSLVGQGASIVIPSSTSEVDYEGELAVVIGRRCRHVTHQEALGVVAGVMPFNDVSARDLQMQTSQWTCGKALDTFAPCGPELVLLDEIGDPGDLRIQTRLGEKVVQDDRTSSMIFDIGQIIAFVSSVMTLEVGDVIATGTPSGVGFTREPPLFLRPGDRVQVTIDGVGTLTNPVVAEPAR